MAAGKIKGMLAWGQNPAVGGSNSNLERKALEQLDWLVATDLWETETASFWKRPGVDPAQIKTQRHGRFPTHPHSALRIPHSTLRTVLTCRTHTGATGASARRSR